MPLPLIIGAVIASAVSAISGALASVGAALSTAGAAVIGAFSSVSSAVSTFLSTNLPILLENLDNLNQCANTCCDIGKKLGLIDDESSEELGNKVLQAQENDISADRFNNYDEYISAIKNYNLDDRLSSNYSIEEKKIMAMIYIIAGLENNCGIRNSDLIVEFFNKNISSEDIFKYVTAANEKKLSLNNLNSYLDGKLFGTDRKDMKHNLLTLEN